MYLKLVSTKIKKENVVELLQYIFFSIAVKTIVLNLFWNCIFHFLGGFTYIPEMLFTNILFFSFSKKFEKCVFFCGPFLPIRITESPTLL